MKKRLLAILLAGCMTVSMLPTALADELTEQQPAAEEQAVSDVVTEQQSPAEEQTAPAQQVEEAAEEQTEPQSISAYQTGAEDNKCGDNLTWSIDDAGTLTISGTGEMFDYYGWGNTAPWKNEVFSRVIIENGVTSVGSNAFCRNVQNDAQSQRLQSVTLADSVKKIGEYAFSYNTGMTTLNLGNGVTAIDQYAFYNCEALTQLEISDSVTDIGHDAFAACSGLSSITWGTGITSIALRTFDSCTALTEITIPENVTGIDWHAFANCTELKTVAIPASVNSIGSEVFWGCTALEGFTVDKANTAFCSVDGVLFDKDKSTLIQYPVGKNAGGYTIPDGVTRIENSAFYNCTSLTSIKIPNSVMNLGYRTFQDCSALTTVEIPNSVAIIESGVFSGCTALKNITIPSTVTDINSSVFSGCTGLETVRFMGTLPNIQKDAFYKVYADALYPSSWTEYPAGNAYNLQNINLLEREGKLTGKKCTTGSMFLNKSEHTMFSGSSVTLAVITATEDGLDTSAEWTSDNTDAAVVDNSGKVTAVAGGTATITAKNAAGTAVSCTLTVIQSDPEKNGMCGEDLMWILDDTGVLTVSGTGAMPDVESPENVAWYDKRNKIKSVVIADGVESIGKCAFMDCDALTSVTFGGDVVHIGDAAFEDADALTSIAIPDQVISIGQNAFAMCDALKTVSIGSGMSGIGEKAFYRCKALEGFTVSERNGSYAAPDGVLFRTWPPTQIHILVQYPAGKQAAEYAVPDGIYEISDYAFADNDYLTSITIPDTINSVGYEALWDCDALTTAYIGAGRISQGFYHCGALANVQLSANVKYIQGATFGCCESLTSLNIPENVASIAPDVFKNCTGMQNITVAEENTAYSAQDGILFNQDKTTLYYYPAGKTDTEYIVPAGVNNISAHAFQNCANLKMVVLPQNTMNIQYNAFNGTAADAYYSATWSIAVKNELTKYGSQMN